MIATQTRLVATPPRHRPKFSGKEGHPRGILSSMVEQTPVSLLQRLRDPANRDSWSEFVELYEPLLFNYIRKRGLRDHDAEDVVQGIFISLLRKLPQFQFDRSKGRFRTWLWQVAHNAIVDWARARRRLQKAEEQRRQVREEIPISDDDWDVMHRQRIAQFVIDRVRAQTAPKTWACFEQHLIEGRSGADVGAELGLPANTVYVYAARVLARIREQCAAYREDLGDD